MRKQRKTVAGFEGSADPLRVFMLGDMEDDDPRFETVNQLAKRFGLGLTTIRLKIENAPEKFERRIVKRAGIKCPVAVYRFKDTT